MAGAQSVVTTVLQQGAVEAGVPPGWGGAVVVSAGNVLGGRGLDSGY